MENQTTTESTTNFDFSSANLPETLYNKPKPETFEFVKPKSKKGLGMTLTEAIGELEKGYCITCDEAPEGRYCYLNGDKLINSHSGKWCSLAEFKSEIAPKDKYVWRIYEPKLKHPTQQKRVEQIANLTADLKATTLTIENQALEINDLNFRNDNLKAQVVTANERIEYLQHENKNYESAIKVYESRIVLLKDEIKWLQNDISNLKTKNEMQTESRERLASKFTNWFIFLVIVSVGSIALNVYQYFNN